MARMAAEDTASRFEADYWTADSHYRRFGDYASALAELRGWFAGLLAMIDPYLPPPGRAVDVGCGHGAIVHALLERGWDARGFDMSQWMIDAARKHAPQLGADRFVVGDVNAFPFDGAFELVTCFEVLEHIPDPLPALGALRDHLAPGGRLIATTPNLKPLMPAKDPLTSDPTHVSVHSPRWWRGAVERTGLRVVRVATFTPVPLLWRVHPALGRWRQLGSRTGSGTLIVAER